MSSSTALGTAAAVLAFVIVAAASPASAAGGTYVVNSTGDQADANAGNGVCATSTGTCTLRAALTEANADGGASTVNFAISGSGPHTIQLAAALPTLTDSAGGTTINGYSQPGATPNSMTLSSNAQLRIQIRGTGPSGPEAFIVESANNTIRGLALFNLRQSARLTGAGAHHNTFAGNFIGTDAAGTFAYTTLNSNSFGFVLRSRAADNTIGGPALADRNVISGNAGRAVIIGLPSPLEPGTDRNVVQNNLVGLTPNGLGRLANLGHGIDVNGGASNNIVADNVVSGNEGEGVEISHGTTTVGNQILRNRIGTDLTGNTGPAYARNGQINVVVEDGPQNSVVADNIIGNNAAGGVRLNSYENQPGGTQIYRNRIGVSANGTPISNGPWGMMLKSGAERTTVGPDNVIAYNAAGIQMSEENAFRTIRNTITRNSIHDNTGLGIDLPPFDQVNQNDVGDADAGPNEGLNWPVFTGATTTSVSGTACADCRVEIFVADSTTTDPSLQSSYGEGGAFLAAGVAGSDGSFTIAIPASSSNRVVTSTATDTQGNTSEFSRNIAVPSGNQPPTASFTVSCPNQTCGFDASGSTDNDGTIQSYQWDFGDNTTGTGSTTSHTYASPGIYTVTLTVTDNGNATATTSRQAVVQIYARDSFTRTVAGGWGTATVGGPYTPAPGSDPASFTVGGETGNISVPVGDQRGINLLNTSAADVDVAITFTTDRLPVGGDQVAYLVARRQDSSNLYRVLVRLNSAGQVYVGVERSGVLLGEAQVQGLVYVPGDRLRLRATVTGTNPTKIQARAWNVASSEPTTWTVTASDSTAALQKAGAIGVGARSTEVGVVPANFAFDDLNAQYTSPK